MSDDIPIDSESIKRVVVALSYFASGMLYDIKDHCDRWCMNTGECPPACPLYKSLVICNRFEERQK